MASGSETLVSGHKRSPGFAYVLLNLPGPRYLWCNNQPDCSGNRRAFFIDTLILLPGRPLSIMELAPVLQDTGLSAASPAACRLPGLQAARREEDTRDRVRARRGATIILSRQEPQTDKWLYPSGASCWELQGWTQKLAVPPSHPGGLDPTWRMMLLSEFVRAQMPHRSVQRDALELNPLIWD